MMMMMMMMMMMLMMMMMVVVMVVVVVVICMLDKQVSICREKLEISVKSTILLPSGMVTVMMMDVVILMMMMVEVSVSVSAQDGIVALGKAHTRSARSLSSLPKVALETVPIFVWLNTDRSRPWRVECRPLPFSTPLSFRRSML